MTDNLKCCTLGSLANQRLCALGVRANGAAEIAELFRDTG